MNEYKYKVIADGNRLLAICDSLDNAIIFLRGYMAEYYAESNLSVRIERSEGSIHGEIVVKEPTDDTVYVKKLGFTMTADNNKNYNRCNSCVHTAVGYDMSPCNECKEIHPTMPESKYESLDNTECDVK